MTQANAEANPALPKKPYASSNLSKWAARERGWRLLLDSSFREEPFSEDDYEKMAVWHSEAMAQVLKAPILYCDDVIRLLEFLDYYASSFDFEPDAREALLRAAAFLMQKEQEEILASLN